MRQPEDVKKMLGELIRDQRGITVENLFLYIPAFPELYSILETEERIVGYLLGNLQGSHPDIRSAKWLVVITDQRFLFLQKSMFSSLHHFEIRFAKIKKISGKLGWFFGEMEIISDSGSVQIFHIGKKDYQFFTSCVGDLASIQIGNS